jgi:hypothetical protein
VHDRVELRDFGHSRLDEPAHGGGAGHAFLIVGFHFGIGIGDGGNVVLEVLHEVGGKLVGHEPGGDFRLAELQHEGVGGSEQRALARAAGRWEFVRKAGLLVADGARGARGARQVLQVEPERIEQNFFRRRGAATLLRLFRIEVFEDLRHGGEAAGGLAPSGEVAGVVFPECLDAAKHIVAAGLSIVHLVLLLMLFSCRS